MPKQDTLMDYWHRFHLKAGHAYRQLKNQYRYNIENKRHYLASNPELWLNPQAHTIHLGTQQIGIYLDRTQHPTPSLRYISVRLTHPLTRTHQKHLRILLDILTTSARMPTRRAIPIDIQTVKK